MQKLWRYFQLIAPLAALLIQSCSAVAPIPHPSGPAAPAAGKTITLLFTNDVESAYDPIPAYWLDGQEQIGGIAEMTTLINQLRATEPNVFLFDSGDIFTGTLAKRTEGRLAFELMISMGYDAMAIGNHEFEYGHEIFEWQKNRAPFPVLGANFFYKGTDHPYAQAHAIIERDGVRIGVIGIMGQDAATAIIPSFIAPLDVRLPADAVRRSVEELKDEVDLIVLLTHQGKTAPMQTDAETDPRLQRDIGADISLAGAVDGIDVLFAGHADAGTPEPVIHPRTGTIIMQTYGQATNLGYLQLNLVPQTGAIQESDGRLIPVDPSRYAPDTRILEKLNSYREANSEIMVKVGVTADRMNRRYIEESDIGNLFADAFIEASGADIAFVHSGSLRKDIPSGDIRLVDVVDVYPFVDDLIIKPMSGDQIRRAIEQSLTLERGLLQLSGLELVYDLRRPQGERIVALTRQGRTLAADDIFDVAAPGFLAEGGDLYDAFVESDATGNAGKVSDILIGHFRKHELVEIPGRGRQIDAAAMTKKQPGQLFFDRLKSLCGARFEGFSSFPEDPGPDFRGQLLVATIETCKPGQLRIPFQVGQNTSRTWILSLTDMGLQLKHDHRHADGSPDEVTMYGGTAQTAGTALAQSFPADAHTARLIPDATTNEWFLSVSEDLETITYYLERHGKARFRANLQRVQ